MVSLKKLAKDFIYPGINILIGIFLIGAFYVAGKSVVQTFAVADMTALNYLRPYPIDYLWQLNIHRATLDRNKVRCYADYYEHLLKIFPGARDAYGLLGYSYHYLNDDPKAIKYLKIAIGDYPDIFWNYYNLAAIYINEARYQEAGELLQKALGINPMASLKSMFASQMVYLPLMDKDPATSVTACSLHLRAMYQTSYVLVRILSQVPYNKNMAEAVKNIHPELYAF